jgi:hypothetical protein
MWLGTAAVLAETCASLHDRALAVPLYEQLRPYTERLSPLGLHGPHLGSLAHHVGLLAALLGRTDDAHARFVEAIEVNDRIGASAPAARSRLSLARLLIGHDTAYAHELTEQVFAEARRLGLTRILSDAQALTNNGGLATPGSRPRTARDSYPRRTLDYGRAVITSRGRTILGRLLTNATDEELQRRFGTQRALRALFLTMIRGFQPAMALGFEGDITFELLNSLGLEGQPRASWWTICVQGRRATARSGASDAPAASIRVGLPDFIRMLTGTQSAVAIFEEGNVEMSGDVLLIARLAEMFGGVTPLPTPA